jgi:hypothetical protein
MEPSRQQRQPDDEGGEEALRARSPPTWPRLSTRTRQESARTSVSRKLISVKALSCRAVGSRKVVREP